MRLTALLKMVVGSGWFGVVALIGVALAVSQDNPVAYVLFFIGLYVAGVLTEVLSISGESIGHPRGGRRAYYLSGLGDYSDGDGYSDGGGGSSGSTGGDGNGGYGGSS